jgi:hypothetical protein
MNRVRRKNDRGIIIPCETNDFTIYFAVLHSPLFFMIKSTISEETNLIIVCDAPSGTLRSKSTHKIFVPIFSFIGIVLDI